ncbi:MAG: divalent-cation tolerance protein CutA [Deltaproteobacteria bacterium]|nr:divalent-cation tolerance protein CutA [Deltaproteobacteria bacterium]
MAGGRSASGGRKARAGGGSCLLVLSTAPDRATAERIARALVGERLAACVNVIPGLTSLYRWKGKIERDREVLCLIKTRKPLLPKLIRRLTALHPYDVPEVIALPIAGGARPYMNWLLEQTT